jgi:maltooligosyltrehalose trehalohydrolase
VVTAREAGGYGLGAQWNDDFHHAVHAAVTGERQGYYVDFGSMQALAKTLTRVFFHDGTWSSFREQTHGRPVDLLSIPAHRFLGYLQDHDQVGNRAVGDRISDLLPPGLVKVAAGLVLTAPFTPMLFMGEEWGADTPWQFFADHPQEWLARAVADGRRAEFAAHGWNAADVPDPQDRQTFLRSKLDWSQPSGEPHAELLAWYRELIALRHARPELTDSWLAGPGRTGIEVSYDEEARWLVADRGGLLIVASLEEVPLEIPVPAPPTAVLAASRPGVRLGETTVSMPETCFAVLAS